MAASVLEEMVLPIRRALEKCGIKKTELTSHSHNWPQKKVDWVTADGVERSLEAFLDADSAGFTICGYAQNSTGSLIKIHKFESGLDVERLRAFDLDRIEKAIRIINAWTESDMIQRAHRPLV